MLIQQILKGLEAILEKLRSERKGEVNQLKNGLDEEKLLRAQEAEVMKKTLGDAVQVHSY